MSIAKVMIASSEISADLYYATAFLAPDPIIFFEYRGRKHLILSDLEIDRARLEAKVDQIHSITDIRENLKLKKEITSSVLILDKVLKEKKIKQLEVPADFPTEHYLSLKKLKYSIKVKEGLFYDSRLQKTEKEKKLIIQSIRQVEKTLKETLELLEKSKIKRNRIYFGKELITSEFLHSFVNTKLMERNCLAEGTIIASGEQGSFPHHHGSGPIIPHTPIIFDIFPKHLKSRYFADMTRTFVKGKASDDIKKMYHAVNEANKAAMSLVKPKASTSKIHLAAVDVFKKYAYKTHKKEGRLQGFIHSTGHGLGLDIHEPPSVSPRESKLKKGYVITIEPGLYYKGLGGIRIEDDVYVSDQGFEKLTKFPKFLEIDKGQF